MFSRYLLSEPSIFVVTIYVLLKIIGLETQSIVAKSINVANAYESRSERFNHLWNIFLLYPLYNRRSGFVISKQFHTMSELWITVHNLKNKLPNDTVSVIKYKYKFKSCIELYKPIESHISIAHDPNSNPVIPMWYGL